MKKKTLPIYLYPDHSIGSWGYMNDSERPSFLPHYSIKKKMAIYKELGLNICLLEKASLKSLPKPKGILVSADRSLRREAIKAGHSAAPNITIAKHLAIGEKWIPVKMSVDAVKLGYFSSLQTYFIESLKDDQRLVIGLLIETDLDKAMSYNCDIEILHLDSAAEDLVMIQLENNEGLTGLYKQCNVLFSDGKRLFLALKASEKIDELPVHGAHGHNFALYPDDKHLFQKATRTDIALEAVPERIRQPILRTDIPWWKYFLKPSTATSFANRNSKYSGSSNLDSNGPLVSRHILHPDNIRVENTLFDELTTMGYSPQKHSFVYGGSTYHNIVADLPGTGRWKLKASIHKKLVREFRKPFPNIDFLKKELGDMNFEGAEEAVGALGTSLLDLLRPYRPWQDYFEIAHFGADILVVGCHLDSTAANSPGYNPTTDAAPGRDDNASGIAGVLEMANYFRHFKNCFTHTIRFCFFNAEEQGLVGSKAYAQFLRNNHAPVKAAICMDMIGFNSDINHLFEIHAGYTDSAVRDLNVPFADEIETRSQSIFGVGKAQIYQGTNSGSGADRLVYDGAINRSDHAAFHEQGYPAVVVSEDFFANLSTEPGSDGNPNYHRQEDTVIDANYGSKITCAVAGAIKEFVK